MNCQEFRELIDSYLCDELLTETNHGVLRHLEYCSDCRFVIEDRRMFRAKLRSSIENCSDFIICEDFKGNLHNLLRKSALPKKQVGHSPFFGKFAFATAAVSVLIFAVLGLWFFQISSPDNSLQIASVNNKLPTAHFQKIALGDHQNCAVNHRLQEKPVEIDLSAPQFASLKEGVLMPLKEAIESCKLVESHTCKYEGQSFTHLVFDYEGKTMSVLLADLDNYKPLEANLIAKLSDQGYQIAHFDVDKKAVFVISDLPENKNSNAAEVIAAPLRRQFSDNRRASLISYTDFRR